MQDLYNNTIFKRALSPVSVADNTAQTTQIIDMAGYEGVLFGIALGSIADADATFAVTVAESDDSGMSGATAISTDNLIGTTSGASFQFDSDNLVRKILARPAKRYVQMTITPSANSSAALMSVLALLIGGKYLPLTQPTS